MKLLLFLKLEFYPWFPSDKTTLLVQMSLINGRLIKKPQFEIATCVTKQKKPGG
jgi:hypothetical protein